jgi:multidrug resistance efflux pump
MLGKYLLPLLAALALTFAVFQVVLAQQKPPPASPPVEPAHNPYARAVSGAGVVEPKSENISVGAFVPGVVTKVRVRVGDRVTAGQPLFELDPRQMEAELGVRKAALAAAEAQLQRLRSMPRKEEVPPSQAKVDEARANLADQDDLLRRTEELYASRSVGQEELIRRRQAAKVAREQSVRAEAELALLKAGAWTADKRVAEVAVEQARAQVAQTQIELDRLKVPASVDGEVLQVNVRPGEFVGAPPGQALVVLGDLTKLHVRVDIDENDIPRLRPMKPGDAVGEATVRGDPGRKYPLRFVRVEPYVVPKKSLTGANTERVDVRVLQVICEIDPGESRLYVGQQVDVFLEPKAGSPGNGGERGA